MNEIVKIKEICIELEMPQELTDILLKIAEKLPWNELYEHIENLQNPAIGRKAVDDIALITKPFENKGLEQLCVYMLAVCEVRKVYAARNISDEIFIDTMKCFPRFAKECFALTGEWSFDRGFWIWRQLSCILFCIGVLEFEYLAIETEIPLKNGEKVEKGDMVVSVHIPSGVSMTREALDKAYNAAKNIFENGKTMITGFKGAPKVYYCNTWLLAPGLQGLLKETSGIKRFASDYEICIVDEDSPFLNRWLFGTSAETPIDQLPEDTSLQKAAKQFLQSGGKIGVATGVLKTSSI